MQKDTGNFLILFGNNRNVYISLDDNIIKWKSKRKLLRKSFRIF